MAPDLDLDAAAHVVATLAQQHRIKLRVTTTMPVGIAAYFTRSTRTATVPPLTDAASFAIVLHELGHAIAGDCPRREPHRPDPRAREWHRCLQCEVDAWQAALAAVPFSRAMYDRLRSALMAYRSMTPGSAAAIQALDRASGTVNWSRSRQRHAERQWRHELVRGWQHDVALGRIRQRQREDEEGRARMKRLFPGGLP